MKLSSIILRVAEIEQSKSFWSVFRRSPFSMVEERH
jgi:hypothetical protein